MIKVEVLKCFKQDNRIYGEFYVTDELDSQTNYLVIQNELDIVVIDHLLHKTVEGCMLRPNRKVREAIACAVDKYLNNEIEIYDMTLEEICQKYSDAQKKATKEYIDSKWKFLEKHNLNNKVRRIKDKKIGYLRLGSGNRINFYPLKKDGTKSLNCNGYFWETDVLEHFEPYED